MKAALTIFPYNSGMDKREQFKKKMAPLTKNNQEGTLPVETKLEFRGEKPGEGRSTPDIRKLAIDLPEDYFEKIEQFSAILLEWNKVHNLSGSTTHDAVMAQVYDSIFPLTFLEPFESALDIGSGAGFPAIPLAIARPDSRFTLVEPTKKRVAFLNWVAIKLGLKNVTLIDKRVEAIDATIYPLITSKAVMSADRLYGLVASMMDQNSTLLLYKGRDTEDETQTITNLKIVDAEHSRYLVIKKD